ncbi:glutamine amidotransferase-like class 1 domain-containing protein 1 [Liolophura sinensis]|uniref:glutamine amidotransferase-like class 1 domain-containing protein 1 n=1 Tax=Liolophura sinensis TaxID=3198878 RepID=UPI0031580222
MSAPRASCLIVLSSAVEGVSAQSFVQAFKLTHTNFSIQLASPGGKVTEFVQQDENNRRWLNDFRTKSYSMPISLESIDAARYSALLIPAAPGAIHDLATNQHLAQIVQHFAKENKPLCAIGPGVAGLCGARQEDKKSWSFADYSMTAPSIFEIARTPEFAILPILLEDFIKDSGGKYSSSECDAVHIVVDRHLVTGQNTQSTLIAVQNLILLCTHKQTKHGGGR